MELFKVSNLPSLKSRRIGRLILAVQQLGIEWFSYDRLIRNLRYKGETPIGDIDEFIGFTEFPSDYLTARLLKESRPLKIYVYSWDHPCKHTRFSQYFSYKVWSDEIRQDLISLQRIPEENIKVCGSSQFSKLFDYLNSTGSRENPFGFPYIYYCCAIGITELIPQETAIIKLQFPEE